MLATGGRPGRYFVQNAGSPRGAVAALADRSSRLRSPGRSLRNPVPANATRRWRVSLVGGRLVGACLFDSSALLAHLAPRPAGACSPGPAAVCRAQLFWSGRTISPIARIHLYESQGRAPKNVQETARAGIPRPPGLPAALRVSPGKKRAPMGIGAQRESKPGHVCFNGQEPIQGAVPGCFHLALPG